MTTGYDGVPFHLPGEPPLPRASAFSDDMGAGSPQDGATAPAETIRYAIRQVGAGWTVYDDRDLEPARVDGRLLVGLERDLAQAMAEALTRSGSRPTRPAAETRPQTAERRCQDVDHGLDKAP